MHQPLNGLWLHLYDFKIGAICDHLFPQLIPAVSDSLVVDYLFCEPRLSPKEQV